VRFEMPPATHGDGVQPLPLPRAARSGEPSSQGKRAVDGR
jgi:hypothetical protein